MFCKDCSLFRVSKIVITLFILYLLLMMAKDIYQPFSTIFGKNFLYVELSQPLHNFDQNVIRNESTKQVSLSTELYTLGYELAEDHEFKSQFIITPKIYHSSKITRTSNSSRKMKVISVLYPRPWFFTSKINSYHRDFKTCPFNECVFESGLRNATADVLLIFVGYLPKSMKLPVRPPGQIWVFSFWESPAHFNYPSEYDPWKSAFNWTFNYRTDSDIFAPVSHFAWRKREDMLPDSTYLEIAKNKTRTAAWFVSNCHTHSKREVYIREMQKYIDVDIYGRCGNNTCPLSNAIICESMLATRYKFYISFENSICKDYVTEKLSRNFQYRTHIIPVVRGGFDYNKYIPNDTFVNTANFSSAKDLALYLQDLGNDHEAYAKMLKAKDELTTLNYIFDWCDVCEKIHTQTETKIIMDIRKWTHKDACRVPNDIYGKH